MTSLNTDALYELLHRPELDDAAAREVMSMLALHLAARLRAKLGPLPDQKVLLLPILRGGLLMYPAFVQTFPHAAVGLLQIVRQGEHRSVVYESLPREICPDVVLYLDPVASTGRTIACAAQLVRSRYGRAQHSACLVAAARGATATIREAGIAVDGISISRHRGVDVAAQVTDFLGSAKTVLDLGCGTGGVSLALSTRGYEVTSADIVDYSVHRQVIVWVVPEPRLPFSDLQFDACLLHVVLHHARDPVSLLREASRVAHRVVIGEELVASRGGKALLALYDRIVNLALVGEPQNNLSDAMWRVRFAEADLDVVRSTQSTVFCWITQKIYLLEKKR